MIRRFQKRIFTKTPAIRHDILDICERELVTLRGGEGEDDYYCTCQVKMEPPQYI